MTSVPSTMKAWRSFAYDSDPAKAIDALTLQLDVPTPVDIQDHQVLVKIHYASVNPIDWKLLTGGLDGVCPVVFPYTPGFDIGGTVQKVGSKVSHLAPGDSVIADIGLVESCRNPPPFPTGSAGAFAQYCAVDASLCVQWNSNLQDVTGLPLAGLTAYQGLFTGEGKAFSGDDLGDAKEGSKVLILGGSGGVGVLAIQLAKAANCHVACTSTKVDFCTKLGADEVINYKEADWGTVLAGKEYDLIFDCIGLMEDLTERAPKVLKKGAPFVSIANFDPTAKSSDDVRFAIFLLKSSAKDLKAMTDMVEAGSLKVHVDKVYDMKDAKAALHQNLAGRTTGKILIKMD